MSGGRFKYKDSELKTELFGWCGSEYWTPANNPMEDVELSDLVFDVLELVHELDWYQCGDSDQNDYIDAAKKFKEKWFKQSRTSRLKHYIDMSIEDLKKQLYEAIGEEPCQKTQTG